MSDPIEYVSTAPEFAPLWQEVERCLKPNGKRMVVLKKEFLRALSVKDLGEDGGMPPELDVVWHQVVLNTRDYGKLCQRLRGQMVHHTTRSEQDDDVARHSRVDATVIAYRKRFREEPGPEDVWSIPEPEQEEGGFTLYINRINGARYTLAGLSPTTTVLQIKQAYHMHERVPPDVQKLIYAGKALGDKQTCEEIGLSDGSMVHMILHLKGC